MKALRLFAPIFVLCCLTAGLGLRCSSKPSGQDLKIQLYYHTDLKISKEKLDKMYYILFSQAGNEPPQRLGGDVGSFQGKEQSRVYNDIECGHPKIRPDDPRYLYIEGHAELTKEGMPKGKPLVVGRFSLYTACLRGKAWIQIVKPNTFQSWTSYEDKRKLETGKKKQVIQRVGHQVVTLPDGRLLVLGGVRSFSPSMLFKSSDAFKKFVNVVEIYEPSTGLFKTLKDSKTKKQLEIMPRVFHTATVLDRGDKFEVVLLGGFSSGKGGLAAPEVLLFTKEKGGETVTVREEIPAELKNVAKTRRAFHSVIELNGKYGMVGGISCSLSSLSIAKCKQNFSNLIYFQTSNISWGGQNRILLTGGILPKDIPPETDKSDGSQVWETSEIAWVIDERMVQEASQNDGVIKLSTKQRFVLKKPRAGHVALSLSGGRVFLYGGYQGSKGAFGFTDAKPVRTSVIIHLKEKEGVFSPVITDMKLSSDGETEFSPVRIFARGGIIQHYPSKESKRSEGEEYAVISGGLKQVFGSSSVSGEEMKLAKNSLTIRIGSGFSPISGKFYDFKAHEQKTRFMHHFLTLKDGRFFVSGGLSKREGNLLKSQSRVEVLVPASLPENSSIVVVPDELGKEKNDPELPPEPLRPDEPEQRPDAGSEPRIPDDPLPRPDLKVETYLPDLKVETYLPDLKVETYLPDLKVDASLPEPSTSDEPSSLPDSLDGPAPERPMVEQPKPKPVSLAPTLCNPKYKKGIPRTKFAACPSPKICVKGVCLSYCGTGRNCPKHACVKVAGFSGPTGKFCLPKCRLNKDCPRGTFCMKNLPIQNGATQSYCMVGSKLSKEYDLCRHPKFKYTVKAAMGCAWGKNLDCIPWNANFGTIKEARCVRVCDPKLGVRCAPNVKCTPNKASFLGGVCEGVKVPEGGRYGVPVGKIQSPSLVCGVGTRPRGIHCFKRCLLKNSCVNRGTCVFDSSSRTRACGLARRPLGVACLSGAVGSPPCQTGLTCQLGYCLKKCQFQSDCPVGRACTPVPMGSFSVCR